MNADINIKDLIGETTEYEKKAILEVNKPKSWCKSVSAFANTFGGVLIFGVSNDNQVIGLSTPEIDAEKISEIIKARLEPVPKFHLLFQKTCEGKTLLLLDISKGEETPYYYTGDGVYEAFVRIGNESVKATATELKNLVMRGKNTSYDSQISDYKANDYAFSKLRERYKKWTGSSLDDKNLLSFGLVNGQGFLTNTGALIADDSPIRWSRLFCTRWNGLDKSAGVMDALDDAEYSGSIISLIENGEAFIRRNVRVMWRKTSTSREELPDYVERSYHEALINALAHRDYLVNGSEVHIDIYDDRIEICSPGGMPDGSVIQERNPVAVPSTRRNPVLADVLNRLGYMERKGSGFEKIISGYESQINYVESKKPTFRSDRYQFTTIMPNLNYDVPQGVTQGVPQGVTQGVTHDVPQNTTNDATFSCPQDVTHDVPRDVTHDVPQEKIKKQIVSLICKDTKISTEKIAMTLGVSSRTIKRHIKDMPNVHYVGHGSNGHWVINKKFYK